MLTNHEQKAACDSHTQEKVTLPGDAYSLLCDSIEEANVRGVMRVVTMHRLVSTQSGLTSENLRSCYRCDRIQSRREIREFLVDHCMLPLETIVYAAARHGDICLLARALTKVTAKTIRTCHVAESVLLNEMRDWPVVMGFTHSMIQSRRAIIGLLLIHDIVSPSVLHDETQKLLSERGRTIFLEELSIALHQITSESVLVRAIQLEFVEEACQLLQERLFDMTLDEMKAILKPKIAMRGLISNTRQKCPKCTLVWLRRNAGLPWSPSRHKLFHTGVRCLVVFMCIIVARLTTMAVRQIDDSIPVLPWEMWWNVLSFVKREDVGLDTPPSLKNATKLSNSDGER